MSKIWISLPIVRLAFVMSVLIAGKAHVAAQEPFATHAMEGAYERLDRGTYISVKIIDWSDAVSAPKSNTIAFSQKLLNNSGCQGMVRGFATAVSSTRAVFKHSDPENACSLTIDFRLDKTGGVSAIRVTEEDCSHHHGLRCSFSGVLKRKID